MNARTPPELVFSTVKANSQLRMAEMMIAHCSSVSRLLSTKKMNPMMAAMPAASPNLIRRF